MRGWSAPLLEAGLTMDTRTAPHYRWGQGCDGWHLVKAEGLSVIQESMPPATSEVRHHHERARQFFFVLSGRATLECEGVVHVLEAHQGLEVAPGERHQMRNDAAVPLQFLVVSAPPSHGDRIAASAP